jgi:hypothetical protein
MSDTKTEKPKTQAKSESKTIQPRLLQPDNPNYRDETGQSTMPKGHGKSSNLTTSVLSDEQVGTYAPNISKYKTYKNGNGVKEYDHLDEWKQVFKPGIWHQYADIDSLLKPDKAPAPSDKTYSATTKPSLAPASSDKLQDKPSKAPQESSDSIEGRLKGPNTPSTTLTAQYSPRTKPGLKPKNTYNPRPATDVPEDKAREDRFTIGDMPEWYQILEKYVRRKSEKNYKLRG